MGYVLIYSWVIYSLCPRHSKKGPIIKIHWGEPHTSDLDGGSNIYSRKSLIRTSIIQTHLSRPCPPFLVTFSIGKLALDIQLSDIECFSVQKFRFRSVMHHTYIGDSSKSAVSASGAACLCIGFRHMDKYYNSYFSHPSIYPNTLCTFPTCSDNWHPTVCCVLFVVHSLYVSY